MVTQESKLFTHLPGIACEIASPLLVEMIWKLCLVRRKARAAGAGLTAVLPPHANPFSKKQSPEVPPIALTFPDSQNPRYSSFRRSETTRKAETTCPSQLRYRQGKSSRKGSSWAPLPRCGLSGPKPPWRGRKWQVTQADLPSPIKAK